MTPEEFKALATYYLQTLPDTLAKKSSRIRKWDGGNREIKAKKEKEDGRQPGFFDSIE